MASRLTENIEFITKSNRAPIYGLVKEPIVPLHASIEHCQIHVPEFAGIDLLMAVAVALEISSEKSAIDRSPLSINEAAAIYFYTMETPFYKVFSASLRSEDRTKIAPFLKYLKLLLSALYLLPLAPYLTTVYRGLTKLHLIDAYPKGHQFIWWQFSSCTASIEVLGGKFCGKSGKRTQFLISTRQIVDIRKYSHFHDEDERLILPGMRFQVKSSTDMGNGLCQIQLEEVSETKPLLDYIHPALLDKPLKEPGEGIISPPTDKVEESQSGCCGGHRGQKKKTDNNDSEIIVSVEPHYQPPHSV